MSAYEIISIVKTLSANDVGTTGAHQAGIHIPRNPLMLDFFPSLDPSEFNPRRELYFEDIQGESTFKLNFIYYNGKLFGRSTRNEYRLTGLTPYFRVSRARPGDHLRLAKIAGGRWGLEVLRKQPAATAVKSSDPDDIIKLSGTWSASSRRKAQ